MIVEIDPNSGFCFGVKNAVDIAEKTLADKGELYSLGPIVHNDEEVERLAKMGLKTINREGFDKLHDTTVLIRAHGEPPSTYAMAKENNITIIEATCPIVKKLQSRIKEKWEDITSKNGQVVIYGKPGHAEVVGLMGQTNDGAILVANEDDLAKIDFNRPVYLFSQTTMGVEAFESLAGKIREGMELAGVSNINGMLFIYNTICHQVSNRKPSLKEFASKHDVIIFVGGKESSNGKMLFSVCREVNPESYFVSSPGEINRKWFEGKNSVGITGATSTPHWLIDEVYSSII